MFETTKVNPFSLIQFFMHKVAFCYTPISTERYLAQCAQEDLAARDRSSSSAALLDIKLDLKKRHSGESKRFSTEQQMKRKRRETKTHELADHGGYFSEEEDDPSDEDEDDEDDDSDECDYHLEASEDKDPGNVINVVSFLLRHPIQTLRLIKEYHLVNNWFLFATYLHFIILGHQTVKSIIMVIVERPASGSGSAKKVGGYFLSKYYPYMASGLTEPYLMNTMNLALLIYCICSRLLSANRILRGSLVNRDRYRRIWITQIYLTTFTYLHFTPRQWVTILRRAGCHEHAIRHGQESGASQEDAQQLRQHLHLDHEFMSSLDKYSKRELMYRYNPIDFGQCYSADELRFFSALRLSSMEDISSTTTKQQTWFTPCFHRRICICSLRTFTLICLLGLSIISCLSAVFLLTVIYSEYITSMRQEDRPETWSEIGSMLIDHFANEGLIGGTLDWISKLTNHYSEPMHVIRSAEMYIFLLLNIPNHLDGVCVYSDLWVITCRIDKLIALFDHEAKLSGACRHLPHILDEQANILDGPITLRGPSLVEFYKCEFASTIMRPASFVNFERSPSGRLFHHPSHGADTRTTNIRVLHIVNLSNLLYYEFIDLRSMHSLYLNLLFIGNGICVSYMLTLVSILKEPVQLVLIFLGIASSLTPVLVSLFYCAMLERRFKTLYISMVQLMNNRDHKLNSKTLERLRIASRLYEKKEGRAMLIFGKYAITQDSMTPIIAYMATAILYLQ